MTVAPSFTTQVEQVDVLLQEVIRSANPKTLGSNFSYKVNLLLDESSVEWLLSKAYCDYNFQLKSFISFTQAVSN